MLLHGVADDPGRVTSATILRCLDVTTATSHAEIETHLASRFLAFAPIDVLAPRMARLLTLRRRLGVRNSTHTLVKILQPFAAPALRLVSYTHPEYRDSLTALFLARAEAAAGGAVLLRGTEGEAVADTRRQVQID